MSSESNLPEDEKMVSHIRPATDEELPLPIMPEPEEEDFEPISLVDEPGDDGEHSEIKVKQAHAALSATHAEYKRPLNLTGKGATRCRIFHSRIAVESLENMETRINDWADSEEIEIKHIGHVLGEMEGKNPKPNILVVVWY